MDYIISDLHEKHHNIIKYANRPFKDVNEMHNVIVNNWNSIVKETDRVLLLGDIMFSHDVNEILTFLHSLKGKLIVVLGNHDKPLEKLFNENKYREWNKKIYIAGGLLELKVDVGHNSFEKMTFCHYPMLSWNGSFHGRSMCYGHVHQNSIKDLKNSYNVCCEVLNYKPTLIREVVNSSKVI